MGSTLVLCSRALQDGGQLRLEWGAAGSADKGPGHVSSAMVAGDWPPGGQLCPHKSLAGSQASMRVSWFSHLQKHIWLNE